MIFYIRMHKSAVLHICDDVSQWSQEYPGNVANKSGRNKCEHFASRVFERV